jgi:hypothetical protein
MMLKVFPTFHTKLVAYIFRVQVKKEWVVMYNRTTVAINKHRIHLEL